MLGCVDKIENRLERPEMASLDGPIGGLAVADERPRSRGETPSILGGGGRLPGDIVAVFQGCQPTSKATFASFGRFLDRGGIARSFPHGCQRVGEAKGKIRLGVDRGGFMGHAEQERGFGLAPGRLGARPARCN
jgi:hypothetical protein